MMPYRPCIPRCHRFPRLGTRLQSGPKQHVAFIYRGLIGVGMAKDTCMRSPAMIAVRPAAVAGTFYPVDPQILRGALAGHLASASASVAAEPGRPPKLLVVPHAGYVYSGDVAAMAYAPLACWRGRI